MCVPVRAGSSGIQPVWLASSTAPAFLMLMAVIQLLHKTHAYATAVLIGIRQTKNAKLIVLP